MEVGSQKSDVWLIPVYIHDPEVPERCGWWRVRVIWPGWSRGLWMRALPTSTGCVTGNVRVQRGLARLRGRAHAACLESEDRGGSEGENGCTQYL